MNPTESRIAEIEERERKATAGPWEPGGPYPGVSVVVCVDAGSTDPENASPPAYGAIAILDQITEGEPNTQASRDAAFIAAARSDIPFLLAELKKARGALRKIAEEECAHPGRITGPGCCHQIASDVLGGDG